MSIERARQERAVRYAIVLKERFEAKGFLRELAGYPNFIVWHYSIVDGQSKKPARVNRKRHEAENRVVSPLPCFFFLRTVYNMPTFIIVCYLNMTVTQKQHQSLLFTMRFLTHKTAGLSSLCMAKYLLSF